MTTSTFDTLVQRHRIDQVLLSRLRREGRHGWESLTRLAQDKEQPGPLSDRLGRSDDLRAFHDAAVALTSAGLLETSTQFIGMVRLPPTTTVEVIIDECLVDRPASTKARRRVLDRLREPLLSQMTHAVSHNPAATLYTVAAICAPGARSEDLAAAAWTAGLAMRHAGIGSAQGQVDLCTVALQLHAFNGVVAELYPAAAAILR